MGIIAYLVHTGMTFKHSKKCTIAFKDFTKVISVKLDVLEITNNRVNWSFIFGF